MRAEALVYDESVVRFSAGNPSAPRLVLRDATVAATQHHTMPADSTVRSGEPESLSRPGETNDFAARWDPGGVPWGKQRAGWWPCRQGDAHI